MGSIRLSLYNAKALGSRDEIALPIEYLMHRGTMPSAKMQLTSDNGGENFRSDLGI